MERAAKEFFLSMLILLLPLIGWSQNNVQSASYLFQQADSLRHAAQLDSSNLYFQRAENLFAKADNRLEQAQALYKLSLNTSDQGDLDKASQYLEDALSLHRAQQSNDTIFQIKYYHQKGIIAEARAEYEIALKWYENGIQLAETSDDYIGQIIRLITSIGDVNIAKGNYEIALKKFTKAQELYFQKRLEDQPLLSRIYNSYGMLYKNKGEWSKARKYFRKSLEIDKRILPSPHPKLAKTNNNLAIIYYYQSDYQHSLEHMKNAVSVLAEFYGENHRTVAAGYNNVGVVYSEMGKLKKAADYLKKALEIKKVVLGENHPEIAIGYMNLGAIYYDMKKYDSAIKNYKTSEALHLKRFPEGHPELADVYANLGEAYKSKGSYKKALDYYHKDLSINLKLLDANHPFIGDTYSKIGETYVEIDNYEMALKYYQKALVISVKDFSRESGFQNPPLEKVAYPDLLLETLELKADALREYFKQGSKSELLDQSLQTYLHAVELIGKLQYSYDREGSKFLLRERTVDIYRKGVETAYSLHKKTGDPEYKEYAFYFAEKSKNQILLEQIQHLNARKMANLPDSLISHERALRSRLTDLQQRLSNPEKSSQKSDSLTRIAIQDSLFQTHNKLENYIDHLESSFPKYHELKYKPVITRVSEIQQKLLSPDQTAVSYFMGNDAFFVFVVSEKAFNIRKLSSDSLTAKNIMAYRQSIQKSSSATSFAKNSYTFFRNLIKPISDLIVGDHLLIIPDGALYYLPFESLVSQNPKQSGKNQFRNLPYLINDYTISYAPSAGYLELNHQQLPTKEQKQLVGFAPVFSDVSTSKKRNLYPNFERPVSSLPLSLHEVKKLGTLFNNPDGFWSFLKPQKEEADIFTKSKATESAFKNLPLENYRYIHLATHAFMLEEEPEKSGILFAAPNTQKEDGTLYASEIYNLQLNARLVTLSACNTGIGSLAQGEGIMSLSRAFQYAGAKNLLVSLWGVDDRSTAELIIDFYKLNQEKEGMPDALREAKINMIQKTQYAHPKYWAPFTLIGQ